MEKFFNQKVQYFVWIPLGSRDNIWIIFFSRSSLEDINTEAVWYCSHYFPLVSTTPAVPACVAYTGGKFATGVVVTGGKFAAGVIIVVVHLDLLISPRIFKKVEWTLLFSGAWGKMLHERNLRKNSRDTVSLNILLTLIKVTNFGFFRRIHG